MKSSNILLCLCAITLCTSICIAETYTTTTKTYYEPVRTVTKTVVDETTNPMYSVNRNDKIEAVQGKLSSPKSVTTTTTTNPNTHYRTITTTVNGSSTATNTVIDETTNPMYSIPRNDKIEAVQGKLSSPKSVTTTTTTDTVNNTKTVTTTVKDSSGTTKTVIDKTTNTVSSADKNDKIQAKTQEVLPDNPKDLQSELEYYESLKTCTVGGMNTSKLTLRTYGINNGLCSFDMAKENPKTGRMVKVCTFNAPMEATKKYAETKLKYERGQIGLEKLSTADFTALTSSLATFAQQYCK